MVGEVLAEIISGLVPLAVGTFFKLAEHFKKDKTSADEIHSSPANSGIVAEAGTDKAAVLTKDGIKKEVEGADKIIGTMESFKNTNVLLDWLERAKEVIMAKTTAAKEFVGEKVTQAKGFVSEKAEQIKEQISNILPGPAQVPELEQA